MRGQRISFPGIVVKKEEANSTRWGGKSIHRAFMEHRDILMGYLAQHLIRREDVEDILQETYVRAINADDVQDIESPKAYLFIIARNLIFRQLRAQSKQILIDIDEVDDSHLVAPTIPADQALQSKEQMAAFIEAAKSLPPQCRRVFLMRKISGMSHKEISAELRISTSTVERHITNAITRCQEILLRKGYGLADMRDDHPQNDSKGRV